MAPPECVYAAWRFEISIDQQTSLIPLSPESSFWILSIMVVAIGELYLYIRWWCELNICRPQKVSLQSQWMTLELHAAPCHMIRGTLYGCKPLQILGPWVPIVSIRVVGPSDYRTCFFHCPDASCLKNIPEHLDTWSPTECICAHLSIILVA